MVISCSPRMMTTVPAFASVTKAASGPCDISTLGLAVFFVVVVTAETGAKCAPAAAEAARAPISAAPAAARISTLRRDKLAMRVFLSQLLQFVTGAIQPVAETWLTKYLTTTCVDKQMSMQLTDAPDSNSLFIESS